MKALSWTSNLLGLKNEVEKMAQTTFNCVLLNYYRDGKDSMGWHADDEKELGINPIIADRTSEDEQNNN